jgi:branched-chain amino acid transport system ATP-binding protein
VADRAYVLDVGRVSLSGAAAELARTDEVQRLYLGHGSAESGQPRDRAPRRTLSRWTA